MIWFWTIFFHELSCLFSTSLTEWCRKWKRGGWHDCEGASLSPSKKWKPSSVDSHHTPGPAKRKGLIHCKWSCQLSVLFSTKDFFIFVPGNCGKCWAIADTCVSAFSIDGRSAACSCFACRRSISWGIMFSGWWLVHVSAILLAWPNSLSWFSVFRERRQASSYWVGLWAVSACK